MRYADEIAEMLKDLSEMRRLLLEEIRRSAILLEEANRALWGIESARRRWDRIRGRGNSKPLQRPDDYPPPA